MDFATFTGTVVCCWNVLCFNFLACCFSSRRLSDVLKRKKPPKRGPTRKGSKGDDSGVDTSGKGGLGFAGRAIARGKSPGTLKLAYTFCI